MNAVKHGLTATLRPLPGVEDGQAWEAHLAQTVEALAPVGYMETMLAERVAVQAWRLGRVVRFESETSALAQERVEGDTLEKEAEAAQFIATCQGKTLPPSQPTEEIRSNLAQLKADLATLDGLRSKPARKAFTQDAAQGVLYALANIAGLDLEAEDLPKVKGVHPSPGFLKVKKWTAGKLLATANALAGDGEGGGSELVFDAWLQLMTEVRETAEALGKRERAEAEARARKILPKWETLQNVARYESHLERSMMNNLHELQRLQAARAGNPVLAPVAVDITTNAGA